MSILNDLLMDIASERRAQDERWGEQNHPCVLDPGDGSCWIEEDHARELCEAADRGGRLSWAHIATEELAESIHAPNDEARVRELTQLAAVCVAWAESIKRRSS